MRVDVAREAGGVTAGVRYPGAQGTSMAAPHIAGLGAYLDSQFGGTLTGCLTLPGCAPGEGN